MIDEDKEFHKELAYDFKRLWKNLKSSSDINDDGNYIGKCSIVLFNVPISPKTLQRKSGQKELVKKYKECLRREFEKSKDELGRLRNKEVLLYLIAYLDKKHYESYDVDNIPKRFCDVLKEFIGDDRYIQILISEKKMVEVPKSANSDQYEQFLVLVTEAMYKDYLFG